MERLFLMFLDHTQRRSTVGRTPLDESSARRRDLYLTTHNTHNRQISTPPVGFEPTISAGERPADHSPSGVLPTLVRRCVWPRNLKNEEVMTRVRSQRHSKKSVNFPNYGLIFSALQFAPFSFWRSSSVRCTLSLFSALSMFSFHIHKKTAVKKMR